MTVTLGDAALIVVLLLVDRLGAGFGDLYLRTLLCDDNLTDADIAAEMTRYRTDIARARARCRAGVRYALSDPRVRSAGLN